MTTLQLRGMLRSTIDEIGGVAPFYIDPDDYDRALNEAQRIVFADLAGGVDAQLDRLPAMVVKETLTDAGAGTALANKCFMPLSARITATGRHITVKQYDEWLAYAGVTKTGFLQATVKGDKLFTNPTAVQLDFYYLRYPKTLTAAQDPELDLAYHAEIWQQAIQILLRKDLDAPRTAMIEAWRNRREVFRMTRQKRSAPEPSKFIPKDLPYQPKQQ